MRASKGILWINGRRLRYRKTLAESLAPGRLPGRGVFETMRAHRGRIFAFAAHVKRMKKGLQHLNIHCPFFMRQIRQCWAGIDWGQFPDAKIRIIVWKKEKKTSWAILVLPYYPFTPVQYKKGFQAVTLVSSIKKSSANIKSIQCAPFLRAYQAAQNKGFAEAVLFNNRGELVEASRSNIFLVQNHLLLTPSTRSGCLAGITRAAVIKLARDSRIKVREGNLKRQDLLEAQEAFLTNSLMGIMPLTRVNHSKIADGKRGVLTQKLSRAYRRAAAASLFS